MTVHLLRLSNTSDTSYTQVRSHLVKRFGEATFIEHQATTLRTQGIKFALASLVAMRGDAFVLIPEDLMNQRRMIIFKVLGLFPRVRQRYFLDSAEHEQSFTRLSVLLVDIPKLLSEFLTVGILSLLWLMLFPFLYLWLTPQTKRRTDTQSMKVLFFRTDYYDGKPTGGSFSHIRGFTDGMLSLSHRLSFIASVVPTQINHKETPLILIPYPRFFDFFIEAAEMAYNLRLVRQALPILQKERPDFIYHRHSGFHIGTAILAKLSGIPLLLEVNNSEYWLQRKWGRVHFAWWLKVLEQLAWRAATKIFVVSEVLRNDLIQYGVRGEKIIVNPNGVDPQKFSPDISDEEIRKQLGLSRSNQLVGFLGTFGVWHGTTVLANAIPQILRHNDQVRFLMIGEGALKADFLKIIEKSGVTDQVILPGLIPHSDVPKWLAACDILVSPHVPNQDGTRFFGSPTKLFEYMAMGKAIVASDLEQIGQILTQEKTALLIKPGSAPELAANILRAAGDPQLRARLGKAARAAVIEHYTWQKNAERVVQAYQELVIKSPTNLA